MNFKRLFSLVSKSFPNIGFEVKRMEKDVLEITASIYASDYFDDHMYCQIIVYNSGSMHFILTFDKLDPTLENYELINQFNDNLSWFKAYISEKDSGNRFFELHYAAIGEAYEKAIADAISFLLEELLDDNTMKYLKPIVDKTY